jgi:hypothetical protein
MINRVGAPRFHDRVAWNDYMVCVCAHDVASGGEKFNQFDHDVNTLSSLIVSVLT